MTQALIASNLRGGRRGPDRVVTAERIAERIMAAITAHRLPPGTQLIETKLAVIFGTSRTIVRQALARLAETRVVTIHRNRGAYVSSPDPAEAREVFAARRVIEPALAATAAARADKADIARLRRHIRLEDAARRSGDRAGLVRLTGEFHGFVARIARNRFLARMLAELEVKTALVIVLYDRPGAPACPAHEHERLVAAIEAGDEAAASREMTRHLEHIEAALHLAAVPAGGVDLDHALAEHV